MATHNTYLRSGTRDLGQKAIDLDRQALRAFPVQSSPPSKIRRRRGGVWDAFDAFDAFDRACCVCCDDVSCDRGSPDEQPDEAR